MPRLVVPTTDVHASFLAALREFTADGEAHLAGTEVFPPGADGEGERWDENALRDPETFARFVRRLAGLADPAAALPPGYVPSTQLWWVEGDQFLGRLSIRHTLTEALLQWAGHIGYAVRPTARRRGHGTTMLRHALPEARRLGIDPALVTCDAGHVASRRIIESAGGVLEDQRDGKLRFWVPTAPGGD